MKTISVPVIPFMRLLTAVCLLGSVAAAQAAVSGAIFTTLADGSKVNANIFSAKCDGLGVYLDGGPGANAPPTAAGLPDGDISTRSPTPAGRCCSAPTHNAFAASRSLAG